MAIKKKNAYKNIHSSFIHNNLKLGTIHIYIYKRMNKQSVVYSYSGMLLSNKKEQITDICNNMNETQKCNHF